MFAAKNLKSGKHTAFPKTGNAGNLFFQPKLFTGKQGDQNEKEADHIANELISLKSEINPAPPFFAGIPKNQSDKEDQLQEKPLPEIKPIVQPKSEEERPKEEIQQQVEKEQLTQKPEEKVREKSENKPKTPEIHNKEKEEIQEKEEEEEEQPLQTFAQKADMPDQKENKNNSSVQTKALDEKKEINNKKLETQLENSKGSGSSLPTETKKQMETGIGANFSNVKIHNDNTAAQMSSQLGAQAFTTGNDIYFNEGKYNPESDSGKHLLAHELTHTVQQGESKQSKLIQKTEDGGDISPPQGISPISDSNGEYSFSVGNYTYVFEDRGQKELRLPMVSVSDFKERNSSLYMPPFEVPNGRNTNQAGNWDQATDTSAERLKNNKINEATASGGYSRTTNIADRIYFFKGRIKPELNIFGSSDQIKQLSKIPIWDSENNSTSFQIDHIVEHQLGGSDTPSNYELLEASANSSSGSKIAWEINRRIKYAYDILKSDYYQHSGRTEKPNLPERPGRANQYVNSFHNNNIKIIFLANDFDLETNGMPERFWSFNQITQGEHMNKLIPLTGDEMREMGTQDDPALFISPNGGTKLNVPPDGSYPIRNWLTRVDLLSRPDFQNLTMNVDAYKSSDQRGTQVSATYSNMIWYLERIPNSYIFYVNRDRTIQNALSGTTGVFQSLRLPGMSPIRIDTLEITQSGLKGAGKVLPTIPLISNADIDIIIDGDSIRLRKLFTMDEFNFPSPFEIKEASLEVSFGTNGLGVAGNINFGINNVGEGHIGAAASNSGGFELEGSFNFDSRLFEPAEISVQYKDETWTIGGQIGIPQGKVRGVKSATITASYSENTFTASGEAELDIPGIQRGNMTVNYGENGFSISGNFDLSSDIPGIRGGNVEARVSKENGADDYNVFVSGTAQPNIPGIDSSLTVTYNNGALSISGHAAYARGMLSGSVDIGATNRTIGQDGQPTGEPDDTMRVYGGGSLTLQLTPWLQATAGVKFLPNGEIEINGRIGLPSTVNVFDRKEFRRTLFSVPTIEIPLFAIPLGPRSLGLVAQISGGLDFSAGFGPGQLRDVFAEVTYNPDREEETVIRGHGTFAIPADAGLTLRGDLGLGLSVAIASLSGGIELAGTLGLQGEASATVDLSWNPTTGVSLDAEGRVTVNPKFTFDINAFARASLGIGWFSISETWRYNLASYSWGPDIQFGVVFPIHYRENEPFNISFDDIQVIYPQLDVVDMAKDLAMDIKDDLFN